MTLKNIMDSYLPVETATDELADFFTTFADKTRMRILSLLSICELCVNDICFILCINQSTVSHQLRNLKDKKIVNCYKSGKRTFYYISNAQIEALLMQAVIATEN